MTRLAQLAPSALPDRPNNTRAFESLQRCCAELDRRIRRGDPTARAEEYLARESHLAADPDAATELIYTEYVAREATAHSPPNPADYLARFPHLVGPLGQQLAIHTVMAGDSPDPPGASSPGSVARVGTPASPDPSDIGPYQLVERLPDGGSGATVWKARHRQLGRLVALKCLAGVRPSADPSATPSLPEAIRREAEAAARLEHPNIVRLYEIGLTDDGRVYLAMELVEGGTLADRLARYGPMSPRAAADLIATLAETIETARQRGVVHGDLKPANILLTEDGQPRISDFGLASLIDPAPQERLPDAGHGPGGGEPIPGQTPNRHTLAPTVRLVSGTPSYMAPEQIDPTGPLGPPTDVYALAAILYELLTGRPPFRADSPLATMRQVLTQEAIPPDVLQPGLPADLANICRRGLAKHPTQRYPRAADLADDLRRFARGEPVRARPLGRIARLARWTKRHPDLAGLTGLVAVLLVATILSMAHANRGLRQAADMAETARRQAQSTADALRQRYEVTRREAYGLRLAEVSALWPNDPGRARQQLQDPGACPPDLRDLPWRLLWHACGADRLGSPDGSTGEIAAWPLASRAPVQRLAFSTDGRHLLVEHRDASRTVWACHVRQPPAPVDDGTCTWADTPQAVGLNTLPDVMAASASSPVVQLATTPHGKRLTLLRAGRDSQLQLRLDAPPHTISHRRDDLHPHPPRYAVLSADGQSLATADTSRSVRLWATSDLSARGELSGHLGPVSAMTFSPDATLLATAAADGTLRLWALTPQSAAAAGRQPTLWTGCPAKLTGLAALRDDGMAAIADDGTLRIWHARQPANPSALRLSESRLLCLAADPHHRILAIGGEHPDVTLVNLSTDGDPTLAARLAGHSAPVRAVAFAPHGTALASASEDGTLRLWTLPARPGDLGTTPCQTIIPCRERPVRSVSFDPAGRLLAIGCDDGRILLWPYLPGGRLAPQPLATLAGHTRAVLFSVFSPDGTTLASGGLDFSVRLWNVATGTERATLFGHTEYIFSAAFSPESRYLITGSGSRFASIPGEVRIWDTAANTLRCVLNGVIGPVVFTNSGQALVTVQDQTRLRLWPLSPPPQATVAASMNLASGRRPSLGRGVNQ